MRNRNNSAFSHPSYRYAELQNGNIETAFSVHHLSDSNLLKITSELNGAILRITMMIAAIHPELSKYIEEMTVNYADSTENGINIQNLKDYHQSLEAMLKNYSMFHGFEKIRS